MADLNEVSKLKEEAIKASYQVSIAYGVEVEAILELLEIDDLELIKAEMERFIQAVNSKSMTKQVSDLLSRKLFSGR